MEKFIKGFNERYSITNDGKIYSYKNKSKKELSINSCCGISKNRP